MAGEHIGQQAPSFRRAAEQPGVRRRQRQGLPEIVVQIVLLLVDPHRGAAQSGRLVGPSPRHRETGKRVHRLAPVVRLVGRGLEQPAGVSVDGVQVGRGRGEIDLLPFGERVVGKAPPKGGQGHAGGVEPAEIDARFHQPEMHRCAGRIDGNRPGVQPLRLDELTQAEVHPGGRPEDALVVRRIGQLLVVGRQDLVVLLRHHVVIGRGHQMTLA